MLALGDGAQTLLTGQAMEGRARVAFVAVGDGAAAYWPLGAALLLALALLAAWILVKRGKGEPARGPAWDCGFAAPPQHLPFGDPLTQPSAAGMGQPLRRMLGQPVLAVTERVEMPEPGTVAPARIGMVFDDRSFALLLAPLAAARDAVVVRTERLRDLSIRQCLMLPFAALVALLLLVAWLEGGA
jgi:hypothetical protein